MRFQANVFPSYVLENSHNSEEKCFIRTVKCIRLLSAPAAGNTISSHVACRLKVNNDQSLKLKAIIGPHGYENCMLDTLKTDCLLCSPTGIYILL